MMSKLVLSDSHDSHWYSPAWGAAAAIAAALSSAADFSSWVYRNQRSTPTAQQCGEEIKVKQLNINGVR